MYSITPYLNEPHRLPVIQLWDSVFGYDAAHNAPALAIDKKLDVRDGLFFVATADDGSVVGTIMAGYDGHRGWLYSLAVHPSHRKRGLGSRLVDHAEAALTELGCVKINLQIAAGNENVTTFYQSLGYAVEQRVSMGKTIAGNISPERSVALGKPVRADPPGKLDRSQFSESKPTGGTMPSLRFLRPRRWFPGLWWLLDATRRVVINLLFLAIIVALAVALFKRGPPLLQDKTALVLALRGPIVEQRAGNIRDTALAQARGNTQQTSTPLRDVLAVLDAAAQDPKIVRAVLRVDDLGDTGLAVLHEVAAAPERFRAAGKQVVTWGSNYDQRQYYLAAHTDEVLLHPFGAVSLEGFGRYRNYYRDALDKIGVTVNLVRVGTYKSFAEPYIANGPSPAAQEADSSLYNTLWANYTAEVERARHAEPGSLMHGINELPERLRLAGGDPARQAFDSKWVDGLKTIDEVRQTLMERGAPSADGKTFRQVSFDSYLSRLAPRLVGDAVGVVVAEGEIVDGQAMAGTVGGESTSELIRRAREDESIKALVLRVDSPGGSVFGSELIRRELELTRRAGKPVVVSMGNVAASGGYWITTASDEVIADASTVTGSIGVFALLPTADKVLDKLGVHTAGTTTTWLGGAGDPRLPADPRFLALAQQSVDHIYASFTTEVAKARKTTQPAVDAIAQGRVWTGAQAKDRGLVDALGSYGDALKSAARRAKLGDDYRVAYIEPEPGFVERVLAMASGGVAQALAERFDLRLMPAALPPKLAHDMDRALGRLATLADPQRPYTALAHCLCGEP